MSTPKEPPVFYVRIVTAHKGGEFIAGEDMRFASKHSAVETCEQLQVEFDADCDPRRAYVLNAEKIPIVAGGAAQMAAWMGWRYGRSA